MATSDLGACEWFVWDLRRSGLIDRVQLDAIVGEFLKRNPRAEAPALADCLVQHGTITPFQAARILNGMTQGLALGPYVLLDEIGSGSMGQVYKASSKNDSNLYAVEVLPRRSMWNVRLARRQVRSFANFSHPAVVPLVDVGTAGGLHYLAWPLAEGQTLESLVQQSGKLPPALAAVYGVQIAQGLTVAHRNNLFHGLVRPSSILIGSDNQARILDFGIGSLLVENDSESLVNTISSAKVNTISTADTLTSELDCVSPESIMEPTSRTPAGDQYSLGCVLYYCLTGRVPFPERSAVEKLVAHQTKEPMPIRELAPDAPEGLCKVVAKLMSKAPEDRFAGCDKLVKALKPFLVGRRVGPSSRPAADSGTKTPWFIAERSEALAGLLLTSRPDVHVRSGRKTGDGVDFFVELGAGEALSTKTFVVQVRGTTSSVPDDWLPAVKPLFRAGDGMIYWPACVFVINVRDNRAVYAWLAEPQVEAKGATLRFHQQPAFHDLDAAAVDRVVDRVKAWYAALPRQLQPA